MKKVLILEDEANIRSFVVINLKRAGYEPVEAACGMEALAFNKGTGGSDAADVTVYGIPCIDNLGVFGAGIHSINESAHIPSLVQSAKWLAAAALHL